MASVSEMVTIGQIADMFDVTRRSVSRWVAEGKLPRPIRPTGGKCYFKRSDVERLLQPQGGGDGDDPKTV